MKKNKKYKKLYRSRSECWIAGICGGMAEYFKIDPVWIRLLFLVLLLGFGITLIIYLIMWIIVPLEPPHSNNSNNESTAEESPKQTTTSESTNKTTSEDR